jgi:hypothetical protein
VRATGREPAPDNAGSGRPLSKRMMWCLLALPALAVVGGCSVDVPDPAAPRTVQTTPAPATPTITPGHDAAAVAAKDMPFAAGDTLAAGIAVGVSDSLREAPGWKLARENVAGENRYVKSDGCIVSTRVRVSQGPLAVAGDDEASTLELFRYLDPTILPAYLETDTLRWGGEPDRHGPRAEVLVFEPRAAAETKATAVLARLFSKAGSSVYVSLSCSDPAGLAAARADVRQRLAIVPPSG